MSATWLSLMLAMGCGGSPSNASIDRMRTACDAKDRPDACLALSYELRSGDKPNEELARHYRDKGLGLLDCGGTAQHPSEAGLAGPTTVKPSHGKKGRKNSKAAKKRVREAYVAWVEAGYPVPMDDEILDLKQFVPLFGFPADRYADIGTPLLTLNQFTRSCAQLGKRFKLDSGGVLMLLDRLTGDLASANERYQDWLGKEGLRASNKEAMVAQDARLNRWIGALQRCGKQVERNVH